VAINILIVDYATNGALPPKKLTFPNSLLLHPTHLVDTVPGEMRAPHRLFTHTGTLSRFVSPLTRQIITREITVSTPIEGSEAAHAQFAPGRCHVFEVTDRHNASLQGTQANCLVPAGQRWVINLTVIKL